MKKTAMAIVWLLAALAFAAPAMGGEVYGPPAPNVTLAPATPAVKGKMRLPSDYVHLANCKAALTGANGDNDIAAFISSHGMSSWAWVTGSYQYVRYRNDRLVVWFDYWGGSPSQWQGADGGYCMGDDSNIVDKAGGAPSGW